MIKLKYNTEELETMQEKRLVNNYLPALTGLIISFVFFCCIFFSLFNYGSPYDTTILVTGFIIVIVWFIFFVCSLKKAKPQLKELILSTILLLILSMYLVNIVWYSGYLNLDVYTSINDGAVHTDTMFHATLSRTYLEYGFPTILANGTTPINYHTGSHLLFGIISNILDVNIVFVYYYLYPIIFVPLFFFSLEIAIVKIKGHFKKSTCEIKNVDLFFILLHFIPVLYISNYYDAGIFIGNYFVSESFLIANTLMLFLISLMIIFHDKDYFNNKTVKVIWCGFCIPLFIALIAFVKISTGALILSGIMYIIFRKHIFSIKHWLLNLWYAAVFFIYYFGLYSGNVGASYGGEPFFKLFAFDYYYIENGNALFHLLYYTLFTVFVILFSMRDIKSVKQLISQPTFAKEESLVVMTLVSFLPGMFFHIYGGSAAYFFMVPIIISLAVFLTYEIPSKIYSKVKNTILPKIAVKILLICICLTFIVNAKIVDTIITLNNQIFQSETFSEEQYSVHKSELLSGDIIGGTVGILNLHFQPNKYGNDTIVTNFNYLDNLPLEQKKESAIFVDSTSVLWSNYSDGDELLFAISGYTGIQTYNAFFFDEDNLSTYHNDERSIRYGMGYGLSMIPRHDEKLTIDEVKVNAKEEGYKYIYYFSNDTLEEIIL